MKFSLLLIFFHLNILVFAQEISSLSGVYQRILDDRNFIKKIEKSSVFRHDTSFMYFLNDLDALPGLTFREKPLGISSYRENNNYPIFTFKSIKKSEELNYVKVTLAKSVNGIFYQSIIYSCLIVRKKGIYKFKNIKIGYGRRSIELR